jgi:hypothetical protein
MFYIFILLIVFNKFAVSSIQQIKINPDGLAEATVATVHVLSFRCTAL